MELMASSNTNISYSNSNINNFHFNASSITTCWDLLHQHYYLPNLGLVNSNLSPYYNGTMEDMNYVATPSSMTSPYISHVTNPTVTNTNIQDSSSTGYLEDALLEFSVRFKRRRLHFSDDDDHSSMNHSFPPHFTSDELSYLSNDWSSNYGMQLEDELSHDSFLSHDLHYSSSLGEDTIIGRMNEEEIKRKEGEKLMVEKKDELLLLEETINSSNSKKKVLEASPSNSKEMINKSINTSNIGYSSTDTTSHSTHSSLFLDERETKKVKNAAPSENPIKKMVYPFGLVKPGGSEGDITLKDINRRILMPPTRPLKHPVGDFACRPAVAPHGPGLSGKAVVALTKIHTQGRGTITIIRTKG